MWLPPSGKGTRESPERLTPRRITTRPASSTKTPLLILMREDLEKWLLDMDSLRRSSGGGVVTSELPARLRELSLVCSPITVTLLLLLLFSLADLGAAEESGSRAPPGSGFRC